MAITDLPEYYVLEPCLECGHTHFVFNEEVYKSSQSLLKQIHGRADKLEVEPITQGINK